MCMRGIRLAMTGKNVAAVETIKMTNRAEMRAPSWPLYSLDEVASAQMTSLGSAVLRSTLLALKAGLLESVEEAILISELPQVSYSCQSQGEIGKKKMGSYQMCDFILAQVFVRTL